MIKSKIIILFMLIASGIYFWSNDKNESLTIFDQNGKFGYKNQDGEIRISPIYDRIGSFNEYGLAKVRFNNKTGYIDKDGVLIIPIIYNKANFYNDVIVAWKDSKWGILNKEGKILAPFIYNKIGSFEKNGLAGASIVNNKGEFKYGFINQKGQVIIPFIYDGADSFSDDGFARVGIENKKAEYKMGCIDTKGQVIIPFIYDEIRPFAKNALAEVGIQNKQGNMKYGYVNKKAQLVIPLIYDFTRPFANGLASVQVKDKWGYIDEKGKIKIEPKYVRVDDFDENAFAKVSTIDDTHFVNLKGEVVVGYVDKGDFVGNGDLTRTIDEYEQIINTKGEIIRLLKKEQTK